MRDCSRQLMLFTEASRADDSRSVWQETKKGRTIPVISGRNFCAWSETLDRVGLSVKTYLEYSVSRLTQFAPIWSVKATKSGFGIMKLRVSVQSTGGNEFSLLRTPDAHCYRGFHKRETFEKRMERGMPLNLNDQVAHMLPTPQGLDLLPTPTANDAKNNGNPSRQNRHSLGLNGVAGGSLNPEWVEVLMGFPVGWTEL